MSFKHIPKCKYSECKMAALFNYEINTDGEYCDEHKLENMIKVSNIGEKWSEDEKNKLLEELEANMDIETIAKNHKRKVGGITSRIRHIANELYMRGCSIEDIILKTKISENDMLNIIKRNSNVDKNEKKDKKQIRSSEINIITELYELKKSLNEINDKIDKMISKIEKKHNQFVYWINILGTGIFQNRYYIYILKI